MVNNNWRTVTWQLPLGHPPKIEQVAVSVHGKAQGPSIDNYQLPDLWCLHLYRYEAVLELDGRPFPLRPGYAGIIPPGVQQVYRYVGLSEHCYCHFRIPHSSEPVAIRAVQDVSDRFESLNNRMTRAAWDFSGSSARRQSVIWQLLWELSFAEDTTSPTLTGSRHPAVEKAQAIIEHGLTEPLSVSWLANEVGVSFSYLSKLFQFEFGENVVGYIRNRRVDRAEHLLRYSTLSVKSIAASVGMADLHQFNRMIHRARDCSPRQLRASDPERP